MSHINSFPVLIGRPLWSLCLKFIKLRCRGLGLEQRLFFSQLESLTPVYTLMAWGKVKDDLIDSDSPLSGRQISLGPGLHQPVL